MPVKFTIILITCASKKEARVLIKTLLSQRLIACGNILSDLESIFWWKGEVQKAREYLALLKTTNSKFKKIEQIVKQVHSYEVPEIIAVPVMGGSKEYLDWIGSEVKH